jgi:Trypsin
MTPPQYQQLLLFIVLPLLAHGQDDSLFSSFLRRKALEYNFMTPAAAAEANHIVGGVKAEEGEFPFYVKFEGNVLCGGSLLSPNRVLTAGHCITDYGWPSSVRIGSTTGSNGKVIGVQCGIIHPNYTSNRDTVANDVAILKLRENVTGGTFIQLNRDPSYPSVSGTSLTVIGKCWKGVRIFYLARLDNWLSLFRTVCTIRLWINYSNGWNQSDSPKSGNILCHSQ